MRESNERIRSVWAAAGTAANKTRKHSLRMFFMESVIDYIAASIRQEEQICLG
jgi:hypothetical protein